MHLARTFALPALLIPFLALASGCSTSDAGREEAGPDAGSIAPGPGAESPDGGTDPSIADATEATPDADPPTTTLTPNQQALIDAINTERANAGVALLSVRADLGCAAQAHSDDIGPASTCQFTGTDGSTMPEDRVVACAGPSLAATLIGCGYLSGSATASGWSADDDTRAIVLDPELKFIGVGENNRHWTAIFDR